MKYFDELKRSMEWLARQSDTFFIGQSVGGDPPSGTGMSNTLKDVPGEKRLELPVFENTQLGMSIGMALDGTKVISVYPRWNFLLCATDQLVNHLDKIKTYSHGDFQPSVIIRTAVGSIRPLHPQAQHVGNFSDAFRLMLTNVEVIELHEPEDIFPAYQHAYCRQDGKSTILVEWSDFLVEK